jgi:hypothetical protein
VFGGGVDVCADPGDRAFSRLKPGDTKVSNFDNLSVGREQKILRFDIAVNHAAPVRMSQSGADLLEVEEHLVD